MKQGDVIVPLKSKKEIQELFSKGVFKKFSFFKIKYKFVPEPGAASMQILWAIPKKYGTAVVRNYTKRVSRAVFFQVLKTINRNAVLDRHRRLQIAFIPKEKFLELSFHKKTEEIKKMLVQIEFLKKIE